MPDQCVEHYNNLFSNAPRTAEKNRNKIDADKIDKMQRIEAGDAYKERIYKKYYRHYPEKPFISQDRELNTDWLKQVDMFGGIHTYTKVYDDAVFRWATPWSRIHALLDRQDT